MEVSLIDSFSWKSDWLTRPVGGQSDRLIEDSLDNRDQYDGLTQLENSLDSLS